MPTRIQFNLTFHSQFFKVFLLQQSHYTILLLFLFFHIFFPNVTRHWDSTLFDEMKNKFPAKGNEKKKIVRKRKGENKKKHSSFDFKYFFVLFKSSLWCALLYKCLCVCVLVSEFLVVCLVLFRVGKCGRMGAECRSRLNYDNFFFLIVLKWAIHGICFFAFSLSSYYLIMYWVWTVKMLSVEHWWLIGGKWYFYRAIYFWVFQWAFSAMC